MSVGNVPAVFVSSTFYDLKHVRNEIRQFIEDQLGYHAILSEFDSFPINPDVTSVENCLQVVERDADLFILIVGGRYGSTTEEQKSITNLEYLKARTKGIPIYVFVDKQIINIIDVWRKNPDSDWTGVVDTPELFKFVDGLLGSKGKGIWVTPFETGGGIISTVRKQLAFLFLETLKTRMRLRSNPLGQTLSHLRGDALRIAIERPTLWEYRLVAKVLDEELTKARSARRDVNYEVAIRNGEFIDNLSELLVWVRRKNSQAARLVHTIAELVNSVLPEALGPEGSPGDPELLIYSAVRIGETYQAIVDWAIDIKSTDFGDEEFKRVGEILSRLLNQSIKDVEEFSTFFTSKFEELAAIIDSGRELTADQQNISYSIVFAVEGVDEMLEVVQELADRHQAEY